MRNSVHIVSACVCVGGNKCFAISCTNCPVCSIVVVLTFISVAGLKYGRKVHQEKNQEQCSVSTCCQINGLRNLTMDQNSDMQGGPETGTMWANRSIKIINLKNQ